MRRLLVCAGVLGCIAVSEINAQSWKGPNAYCPVGSTECASSYFDVARSSETIFSLFLGDLFGSDRGARKRVARPFFAPRAFASKSETPTEAALTNESTDDRRASTASSHESSSPEDGVRNSWAWADLLASLGVWGWPGHYDFKPGLPDHAAASVEVPSDGVVRANSEDARSEGSVSEVPIGSNDNSEPAFKPDIVEQPNAALAPEPSTLLLISTGIPIAAAILHRRRRR